MSAPLDVDAVEARAKGALVAYATDYTRAMAREDLALIAEVRRLRAALAPFAHFAEQWDAQPIRGLARADDQVIYGIHSGTPWMAELTAGDMRRARAALAPTGEPGNG